MKPQNDLYSPGDRVIFDPPPGTIGKLPLDAQQLLRPGDLYTVNYAKGDRIALLGYDHLLSKTIHNSCFKPAEKATDTNK